MQGPGKVMMHSVRNNNSKKVLRDRPPFGVRSVNIVQPNKFVPALVATVAFLYESF